MILFTRLVSPTLLANSLIRRSPVSEDKLPSLKFILTRLLLSRDVVDKIVMRAPFSGILLIFEQSHFTRYRALFYVHLSDESKKLEKQSNFVAFSRNHRVTVNNSG
ncbi:hypothetical protein [Chordicoccus furentiruminis]|uniref:hypothetical protein n=1 Tax=Chordicoccus furentiruminis TaxID=2709410 RepID=UPI0023A7B771|nr:hypothetical protein [Chordicoccus furentiruminis]